MVSGGPAHLCRSATVASTHTERSRSRVDNFRSQTAQHDRHVKMWIATLHVGVEPQPASSVSRSTHTERSRSRIDNFRSHNNGGQFGRYTPTNTIRLRVRPARAVQIRSVTSSHPLHFHIPYTCINFHFPLRKTTTDSKARALSLMAMEAKTPLAPHPSVRERNHASGISISQKQTMFM